MSKYSMALFQLAENKFELFEMLVTALEMKNYLYSKSRKRESEMLVFSSR